ncbi:hypothetical protein SAMN06296386_11374 [Lachnospiraceae bacterium]|nr:hypothetical protein SAMN06296386_11374 [Lachnospiraceae bacterium]
MIDRFWQDFERSRGPEYPELKQLLQKGGDHLPDEKNLVSDRFLQLQFLYGYLFFGFISAGTGLNFLDHRITAKGWPSIPREKRNFYQKFSYNGTDHFYIGSFIHVERLSEEEKRMLMLCLVDKESTTLVRRAGLVIRSTYKKVLAVYPEKTQGKIEIQTKEDGTIKIDGSSLILGMCSTPAYNADGQYTDMEGEVQRRRVLRRVREEIQEKVSKFLGTEVVFLLDL